MVPVILEIVASDDGKIDTANWVARSVTDISVAGLLTDVRNRWDRALGRVGCRGCGCGLLGAGGCSSARNSDLGRRGRAANRGVLGIAVALAQTRGLRRAVAAERHAPAGIAEAVHGSWPAGVEKARGKLEFAVSHRGPATGLVVELRKVVVAPVPTLVLAGRRHGGGSVADRRSRRGGSLRCRGGRSGGGRDGSGCRASG